MFSAYFDASGKVSRPGVLSIAGHVSDVKKWKRFGVEWKAILDRESVSLFHMTDFVSSQGEFVGWKGDTARRKKFISDLLLCAKKHTNKTFGGALVLKDYESANRHYQLEEFAGRPYALCAHFCVKMVQKWQEKNAVRHVVYFFEHGDDNPGDLIRLCKADGIEPMFLTKQAIPFQAGDLIAFRTRDGFEKALNPDLTFELADKLRASFSQAWKSRHAAFYGDSERIEKMCMERGIPNRPSALKAKSS
jgi:hypothetical protein